MERRGGGTLIYFTEDVQHFVIDFKIDASCHTENCKAMKVAHEHHGMGEFLILPLGAGTALGQVLHLISKAIIPESSHYAV